MKTIPWLEKYQILVCTGSGGVGKTTLSAALGVLSAAQGYRTLVLTIDPAQRLAKALGLSGNLNREVVVEGVPGPGSLSAYMIDAPSIFTDFVKRTAPTPAAAERVIRNRLFREMASTLNGSQEFTSLEKLLEVLDSGRYDRVILDTPPAQNAVDFFRAPERIFSLFQESITRWFVRDQAGSGLVQKLIHRGTRTVMSALERVTGSKFIGELADFFEAMTALQKEVSQRSIRVHRLLGDTKTGFILVTGFDESKLREADEYLVALEQGGHHLGGVIVNRFYPLWLKDFGDPHAASDSRVQKLLNFHSQMRRYFLHRQEQYSRFTQRLAPKVPVLRIAEMRETVSGVPGLVELSRMVAAEIAGEEKK